MQAWSCFWALSSEFPSREYQTKLHIYFSLPCRKLDYEMSKNGSEMYIWLSCRRVNCILTITTVYVLFMFCYARCFHLNNEMPDEPRQTWKTLPTNMFFFHPFCTHWKDSHGFLAKSDIFLGFLLLPFPFSYYFPFRLFNFFGWQRISSKWFLFCPALLVLLFCSGSFFSSAFKVFLCMRQKSYCHCLSYVISLAPFLNYFVTPFPLTPPPILSSLSLPSLPPPLSFPPPARDFIQGFVLLYFISFPVSLCSYI